MKLYSSMKRRRKKKHPFQTLELQKKLVRSVLILGAIVLLIVFFFGDHGILVGYTNGNTYKAITTKSSNSKTQK